MNEASTCWQNGKEITAQREWKPKPSFFIGAAEQLQESSGLEKRLEWLARLGYEGIELMVSSPSEVDVSSWSRSLERHGLGLSGILSGGIYLRHGVCYASTDPAVRSRAISLTRELVQLAGELPTLVVLGLIRGRRSDVTELAGARKRIVECLKQVSKEAERRGVTCVLEPVNHLEVGFTHTVRETLEVIGQVGSPALQIMADTFHLNIEETSVEEAIRACGDRLAHFHLCDTNRRTLGTGHLNFQRIFDTLRDLSYQGYCTAITEYDDQSDWQREASKAIDVIKQAWQAWNDGGAVE